MQPMSPQQQFASKGNTTPMKAGISQPLQSIANIANQVPSMGPPMGRPGPYYSPAPLMAESKESGEERPGTPPAKEDGRGGTHIPSTPVVDKPENHTVISAWGDSVEERVGVEANI
jgi:hypothetical protein